MILSSLSQEFHQHCLNQLHHGGLTQFSLQYAGKNAGQQKIFQFFCNSGRVLSQCFNIRDSLSFILRVAVA